MNQAVENEPGELAYLRFFRQKAIDMLTNRHWDDAEEAIQDMYDQAGCKVPKEYAKS